jgi:hypothetical protein
MGETRRIKKGGWYGNRPKDPKKGFYEEDLWRIPGRRSPSRTVKSVRFAKPLNSGPFVKPVNSGTFVQPVNSGTFVQPANSGASVNSGTFVQPANSAKLIKTCSEMLVESKELNDKLKDYKLWKTDSEKYAYFTAVLNPTTDTIDTWIRERYALEGEENMKVKTMLIGDAYIKYGFLGKKNVPAFELKSGMTEKKSIYKLNKEFNDYNIYTNTGCSKNDCLIISFLMGISPAYRKLDDDHQCKVSNIFRRHLLPAYIEGFKHKIQKTEKQREDIVRQLESGNYLYDDVMGVLADICKIKILSLETYKAENGVGMPPSVIDVGGDTVPGIIIINFNNGHFEIIGKDDKTFLFDSNDLEKIHKILTENTPYSDSKGNLTNTLRKTL